jgi:hypothetical protein
MCGLAARSVVRPPLDHRQSTCDDEDVKMRCTEQCEYDVWAEITEVISPEHVYH